VAGVLRMAALALTHSNTALGLLPPHCPPQGRAVATFATARKLAALIFRMLRYGQDYVDEALRPMKRASSNAPPPARRNRTTARISTVPALEARKFQVRG